MANRFDDMSLRHYLKDGIVVICAECKMHELPGDQEPCKTCLANHRASYFGDNKPCFFEPKNQEEYTVLGAFLEKHKAYIHQLYEDSQAIGVPIDKLAALWEHRDILLRYCGDEPPMDIFKEAEISGVAMDNFKFQIRHNHHLLRGDV